jgi:hypothetical protein
MTAGFGEWTIQKHFYTVENGVVYEVGNGRHGATGDELISVHSRCHRLGDYDPSQTYELKMRNYTFKEIDRLSSGWKALK